MTWWSCDNRADDVRPWLMAAMRAGEPFALATIVVADGGPRLAGTQMVIRSDRQHGFLSGGCIEADVALQAHAAIADGQPRRLVYGRGSPFVDLRLPCGGRLDVLVERVHPDDPALHDLEWLSDRRQPALWRSDGTVRTCMPAPDDMTDRLTSRPTPRTARVAFAPRQRLMVVGSDPFACAIATIGLGLGWEVTVIGSPGVYEFPAGLLTLSDSPTQAFAEYRPDRWTAIAVTLHDADAEVEALVSALRSGAGYVGAMGSRSRLAERRERLQAAGLDPWTVARLRAPIGLALGGRSPGEVALSVAAEIVQVAHGREKRTVPEQSHLTTPGAVPDRRMGVVR